MKKTNYFIIPLIIITLLSFLYLNKDRDIKIGFVGGLSGKYSNLGHSVLNGLKLAFDEERIINGKKIDLVIKDDMQNEEVAKNAIDFFEKEKINIVVGNITSSMTKVSLDRIKDKNIFLISPSSSSSQFSNIDDNFFRLQVAQSESRFDMLSKYLISKNKKNIYVLYDKKNKTYTKNYLKNFEESLISNGGTTFLETKSINIKYENILKDIKTYSNIDAILIVANSLDSSRIIQYLKLNNLDDKTIIASGWAKSREFIEYGGRAVKDVIFLTSYDENSKEMDYLDFVDKYKNKYNTFPTMFSAQGYETGKIIIKVLKENMNTREFKSTLLKIGKFKGLQGFIKFNIYGDIKREQYLTKVKDNEFKRIDLGNNEN